MKTLLAVAALAPATAASAAAPANDAFAGAAPLAVGTTLVDNIGATAEAGEPKRDDDRAAGCAGISDAPRCASTVWFTLVAPSSATYSLDTCDSGDLDTTLEVFTGTSLATLTSVAYGDDGASASCDGGKSALTFAATSGVAYRVRLAGYAALQGSAYLRLATGDPTAATPSADTRIRRFSSVAGLAGAVVAASGPRRTASFEFGPAPGTAADASFACSLDGAPYAGCTSPASYAFAGDTAQHEFRVRAVSGTAVDDTPVVERFTITRTPPVVTLKTAPAEGASGVALPTDILGQLGDLALPLDATGALCDVDAVRLTDSSGSPQCPQPLTLPAALCGGAHTVAVRAIDLAGNVSAPPASRSFTTGGATCSAPTIVAMPATGGSGGAATFKATINDGGRYAQAGVDFGPTTAYGQHYDASTPPLMTMDQSLAIGAIVAPSTTYHYRLTLRTAGGTVATPDQTFTTAAVVAGESLPTVTTGTPVVTGPSSVSLPITVTNGTPARALKLSVFLANDEPATPGSTNALGVDNVTTAAQSGPVTTQLALVDVEPGEVLHYVVRAGSQATPFRYAETVEKTFTMPTAAPDSPGSAPAPAPGGGSTPTTSAPPPAIVPPRVTGPVGPAPIGTAFKLTSRLVSIGKITRRSTSVRVKLRGLPPKAKLAVSVKGATTLAKASATLAGSATTKTLTLKLGTKARRALKRKALKRLSVTVSVTPAGGKRQSLTKRLTLK